MSKDSLATYYENNRERLQKSLVKNIKVSLKKKKKERNNMCVNDIKISLKIKNEN